MLIVPKIIVHEMTNANNFFNRFIFVFLSFSSYTLNGYIFAALPLAAG